MDDIRPEEPATVYPGFCFELPSPKTAAAIFDNWVSTVPGLEAETGKSAVFSSRDDPRPAYAREVFGSLSGFDVLELGALEGGHTYQLENLGANVTAIEAFNQSYLKLLIVKEVFGLRARALYGNFVKYLEAEPRRYHMIFACGVLYHMTDPLHVLHLIAQHTDRVFLWTHYVPPGGKQATHVYTEQIAVNRYGFEAVYHRNIYGTDHPSRLYSGLAPYSHHMTRDTILAALRHFGYGDVRVMAEHDFTFSVTAAR
jgi:hypothetical protein